MRYSVRSLKLFFASVTNHQDNINNYYVLLTEVNMCLIE